MAECRGDRALLIKRDVQITEDDDTAVDEQIAKFSANSPLTNESTSADTWLPIRGFKSRVFSSF